MVGFWLSRCKPCTCSGHSEFTRVSSPVQWPCCVQRTLFCSAPASGSLQFSVPSYIFLEQTLLGDCEALRCLDLWLCVWHPSMLNSQPTCSFTLWLMDLVLADIPALMHRLLVDCVCIRLLGSPDFQFIHSTMSFSLCSLVLVGCLYWVTWPMCPWHSPTVQDGAKKLKHC